MTEFQGLSNAEKVNALTEALGTADAASTPILKKAISEAMGSLLKENGIGSFAELNPGLARTLGLGGKALKLLLRGGLDIAGMGLLSRFLKY